MARREKCDVIFAPGGSHGNGFHPVVTMCQNMLPFEARELARYGISRNTVRLIFLRWIQKQSFIKSEGVIFLTDYARRAVLKVTGKIRGTNTTIPHGLSLTFLKAPKKQNTISEYHQINPYKILYVSIIDQYKHQWNVVEAVWNLRQKRGWPVVLEFVGPAYLPALKRLSKVINRLDPKGEWAKYKGETSFLHLPQVYHEANLGVFASSCENMPNILLEMMAAGLPVASSNRGPMPEFLGDAGLTFNPLSPLNISDTLERLIGNKVLRKKLAEKCYHTAQKYSWEACSNDTLRFLADVRRSWDISRQ